MLACDDDPRHDIRVGVSAAAAAAGARPEAHRPLALRALVDDRAVGQVAVELDAVRPTGIARTRWASHSSIIRSRCSPSAWMEIVRIGALSGRDLGAVPKPAVTQPAVSDGSRTAASAARRQPLPVEHPAAIRQVPSSRHLPIVPRRRARRAPRVSAQIQLARTANQQFSAPRHRPRVGST